MKIVSLLVISLFLSSCASNYKDFKLKQIRKDEVVAIGKIKINYNGMDFTEKCHICIIGSNDSCGVMTELLSDGIFFQNIKKGKAKLARVQCIDVSPQLYIIDGAELNANDEVQYIGDIQIDWKNEGGFKFSTLFGVFGGLYDEANNDGEIRMSVKNNGSKELEKLYSKQIQSKATKVTNQIIKVGK